jgi:hypothetical protein
MDNTYDLSGLDEGIDKIKKALRKSAEIVLGEKLYRKSRESFRKSKENLSLKKKSTDDLNKINTEGRSKINTFNNNKLDSKTYRHKTFFKDSKFSGIISKGKKKVNCTLTVTNFDTFDSNAYYCEITYAEKYGTVTANCKGKILDDGFMKIKEIAVLNHEKSIFKHPMEFDVLLAGSNIEGI